MGDQEDSKKVAVLESVVAAHLKDCDERGKVLVKASEQNAEDHRGIMRAIRAQSRVVYTGAILLAVLIAVFSLPDVRNWIWDMLPPHHHIHNDRMMGPHKP